MKLCASEIASRRRVQASVATLESHELPIMPGLPYGEMMDIQEGKLPFFGEIESRIHDVVGEFADALLQRIVLLVQGIGVRC